MIFDIGLSTSICAKELSLLRKMKTRGFKAFVYVNLMGSMDENCTNSRGEVEQIDETPKDVPFPAFYEQYGVVNVCKDIEKYLKVRFKMENVPELIQDRFSWESMKTLQYLPTFSGAL